MRPGIAVFGHLLVLVAVAVAWWSPALGFYFSQDDFPLLATSHPGWVSARTLLLSGSPREYRPLSQHVYFWVNQLLFGLDPRGHHAATLAVHLANAMLVGVLARRWIARWALVPAGLLFALHPVHFFEASWVSGVNQSACVFFILLALWSLDSFLVRPRKWLLAASLLAAASALLSKEDAVMLPVLATGLALARCGRTGWRSLASVLAPFWLLVPAFIAWRFGVLGYGLPSSGVYRFSLEARLLATKALQYTHWLLISWPFAMALAGALAVAFVVRRAADWRPPVEAAALLLLSAPLSVAPTLLVPSSASHYLSFASAVLAVATVGLVRWLPRRGWRPVVASLLAVTFLASAWRERDRLLASRNMSVPIPAKAALCRRWVEALQGERRLAKSGCDVVLRDVSLERWEWAWLSFLPMIAWDTPLALERVHVVFAGDPEPPGSTGGCSVAWSLTRTGARRVSPDPLGAGAPDHHGEGRGSAR